MKNAEQTNKVAGPGEKVLPGDAVSVSRENNLPLRGSAAPAAQVERAETNGVAAVPVAEERAVRGPAPADDAAAVSDVSDVRARTLERTHDLVAQHAVRLVDAKADLLHVVLKPGGDTRLSLELRQRGDGIEARAVLQRGDLEQFQQHWPELQQRLEQRGIRLSPLASDGHFAAGSGGQGFQRRPDQPAKQEPLLAGTFVPFAPAGALGKPPGELVVHAGTAGGWQSWA